MEAALNIGGHDRVFFLNCDFAYSFMQILSTHQYYDNNYINIEDLGYLRV